jgi:ectoine hydroxylase-related dioxygenase (phytanoyl-CoA dioxygenase family)
LSQTLTTCIARFARSPQEAAVHRLLAAEGAAAGSEFRQEAGTSRLAALVGKDGIFERLATNRGVLEYVAFILGGSRLKLSSANARVVPSSSNVNDGPAGRQPLHADFSAVADDIGPWVVNVLVALAPYSTITGPLRAVPGSHRWQRLPAEDMPDPSAAHPAEVQITCDRGDCIVMNAHTWHSGTENLSPTGTRGKAAVHLFWCRRDMPQQQHQKRLIPLGVQQSMNESTRWILALDSEENEQAMRELGDQTVSGAIPATSPPQTTRENKETGTHSLKCNGVARM